MSARLTLETNQPAAALLDLYLPHGFGLDLLGEFSARWPHLAVIIIPGEVTMENAIAALRRGVDDFISKSINLNELHSSLMGSLARRQQTEEKQKPGRSRLLVVTDAADRMSSLRAMFAQPGIEITAASSGDGLEQQSCGQHDLVVVDVGPQHIRETLQTLRQSNAQQDIPVLVTAARITDHQGLSGVLPQYRAMPCSPVEMLTLVRRLTTAAAPQKESRHLF